MPNYPLEHISRARSEAQRVLSMSPSFVRMNDAEQLALYRHLVDSNLARMQSGNGFARGFADPPPPEPPGGLARTDIENKRFDQLPQIGADFIQQIDFPQFVKDLLQGVFDANLKVTLQQMKTYQDLLKTASKSIAQFAKDVKEQEAFGYLAETQSDLFSLCFDDEEGGEGGGGQRSIVLTDKDGNKLDLGDNEVKAKIMEATIALAKERRAMLRETILMGITRLVVEKGVVEASVLFDVGATEKIESKGKAGSEEETTRATEDSGGWFSSIFGGDDSTSQSRKSKIQVSSVKAIADSKLAAQIKGSVKIQFKSDYFKLDNFAALYQDGRDGGSQWAAGGGAGAARPPGQVAAPGQVGQVAAPGQVAAGKTG